MKKSGLSLSSGHARLLVIIIALVAVASVYAGGPSTRLQQQMIRIASANLMRDMVSAHPGTTRNSYRDCSGAAVIAPAATPAIAAYENSLLLATRVQRGGSGDSGSGDTTFPQGSGCTSTVGTCNGQTYVHECFQWTLPFSCGSGTMTSTDGSCTVQGVCLTFNGGSSCSWTNTNNVCQGVTSSPCATSGAIECYPTMSEWCLQRTFVPACGTNSDTTPTVAGIRCTRYTVDGVACSTVSDWCKGWSAANPNYCSNTMGSGTCQDTYIAACMATTGGGCTSPSRSGCTSRMCTTADNPMCVLTYAWNCATSKGAGLCKTPTSGGGSDPGSFALLSSLVGLSAFALMGLGGSRS